MKKFISGLFLLISCFTVFSEAYKINKVTYDISGFTRKYALSQKVPVDTDSIFEDSNSFNRYIATLKQLLSNQRIFQKTDIALEYLDINSEGVIPVNLLITTVDTVNIIGVPYPSYDSNSGLTLKIKLKDYNFLGSMETMAFDLNYQAEGTDDLEDVSHIYGLNFNFSIPFNLIVLPSSWNSDFGFSYTVGNPSIDLDICEGIDFSLPFSDTISLDFSFDQYYIQDSEYIDTKDDRIFKESFTVSLPFIIASIPDFTDIFWSPSLNYTYNWDADAFDGVAFSGISDSDLKCSDFTLSNSFSAGQINWLGNFRDGFSAKLKQSIIFDVYDGSSTTVVSFSSQYHKQLCSFIGFSSRQYWDKNFSGEASKFGSLIRGIRDVDWLSPEFLVLNFDFPISLIHTNWGKWLGWDKLNFFNFDFQLSPFLDAVIGTNTYAGSKYNLKDGWYGSGFEVIVFPDRFRSIQVRASLGFDVVQYLQKKSTENKDIQETTDALLNTEWRSGGSSGKYELSIGVGLFY